MMCLFKPNSYDPKDWQCPKPSCRTVNFKKRLTCISCGARKPDGACRPLDDWRDGEKFPQGPWDCDVCRIKNEAGAFYCSQCKKPSPDMARMMEEEKAKRQQEEGRGGGLFDRQDPNDKKAWDSDGEEFDEFGRRKKKRREARSAASNAGAAGLADRRPDSHRQPEAAVAAPVVEACGAGGAGDKRGVASEKPKTSGASDKHKAALERLRNKHVPGGGGQRDHSRRSRSRSRSRARRR